MGSFFSSMPVTGGFSWTAVNYQSGAKTVLASIITAILITITLLFLTPLFYYLPNAVPAAIIMVAVYGLIDFQEAKYFFQVKKTDGLGFAHHVFNHSVHRNGARHFGWRGRFPLGFYLAKRLSPCG